MIARIADFLRSLFVVSIVVNAVSLQVFAQCGAARFETLSRKAVAPFALDRVIVEDFNGDNRTDAAVHNPENNTLTVYLNDGAGNFADAVTTNVGAQSSSIVIGDLNGDNRKDAVVVYLTNPVAAKTFLSDAAGNFVLWNTTDLPFHPRNSPQARALAAFNDDALPDLVVNNFYFALNANGAFSATGTQLTTLLAQIGDFNNDGKADFAAAEATSGGAGRTSIFINNGSGTAFAQTTIVNEFLRINAVADLNNDNKSDIIALPGAASAAANKVVVLHSAANNSFARSETILPDRFEDPNFYSVKIGDFNADNFKDLLIPSASAASSLNTILYGSANNAFAATNFAKRLPASASANVYADFDGDNKTDYLSIARGTFFPYAFLLVKQNVCAPIGQTKIADFDGDAATDLALWRASDGRWTIQNSNGEIFRRIFWGRGDLGDVPTPGDFDGDGRTDIAVWRASNQVWYTLRSSDNAPAYVQWGLNGDKPVAADYDGDGKTDVAVFRPSNGVWYIRKSTDGALFAAQFGLAEDKPVPADYDGDNKADIAVWRPSNGVWYRLNSRDNYRFSVVQWGTDGDKPAPADYDGDGKADVTVWRPSPGVWYLRSSFNDQIAAYQYGASGDAPIPGNYNLFGNCCSETALLGVYRAPIGAWFLNISSFSRIVNLGESDEIPISALPRLE